MKRLGGIWILCLPFIFGCNLFGGIDRPSGDEQWVSAARACFDAGDIACAREYYEKLSDNQKDIRVSEETFLELANQNITMGVLLQVIGKKNATGGTIITDLANVIAGQGASQSKRKIFFSIYENVRKISNPQLRGFVRFAVGATLLSELFAEIAGTDLSLQKTDIVTGSSTGCAALTSLTCNSANCDGAFAIGAASSTFSLAGNFSGISSSNFSGNATMSMVDAVVKGLDYAMGSNELGASGKFGAGLSIFSNSLVQLALSPESTLGTRCYRYQLISLGVGY